MTGDYMLPSGDTAWPCHAGSGECRKPARFVFDNGEGGEAYYCEQHAAEFKAMEKFLNEHPDMMATLQRAIEEHE